jgi:hypothetical protein
VSDLGETIDGAGRSSIYADEVVEKIRSEGGRAVANYDSVATEAAGGAIVAAAFASFGRVDIVSATPVISATVHSWR